MLALHNKRRDMLSKGVFCSIIVHICILQQLLLKQLGSWNLSAPTSPYILELATLDYHMFLQKKALHGQRFASDDEIMAAVCTWLWSQLKTLFLDGIRRLVNHYKYALEKVVIMLRNNTLYICYRLLYMK